MAVVLLTLAELSLIYTRITDFVYNPSQPLEIPVMYRTQLLVRNLGMSWEISALEGLERLIRHTN